MKFINLFILICVANALSTGCTKNVSGGFVFADSDENNVYTNEMDLNSIHYLSGTYKGKICFNTSENLNFIQLILKEDSTFEFRCENIDGNSKKERIKGLYGFTNDTLTLYTAVQNKQFIIKNKSLHYLKDSLFEKNKHDYLNILYKY